jgi:hypothetical protein
MTMRQVQGGVSLTLKMLGLERWRGSSKHISFKTLRLSTPLRPKRLDLAMHQAQGSVSLTRIPDPKHLDLVVSQVQDDNQSFLGLTLGKNSVSISLATLDVLNSNLSTSF